MLFALLGVENWSSLGVVLEHDWWARTAWAVRETLTEEVTRRGPGGPKRISLSKIRISVLLSSYPLLYFKSSFTWMTSQYTQSHTSLPEMNTAPAPESITPPYLVCIPPWDTCYPPSYPRSPFTTFSLCLSIHPACRCFSSPIPIWRLSTYNCVTVLITLIMLLLQSPSLWLNY